MLGRVGMDAFGRARAAIAIAAETTGEHPASGLLAKQFGVVNARILLRDCRDDVNRLHTAFHSVSVAIGEWDGSTRSAARIARASLTYTECMRALETRLDAAESHPRDAPTEARNRRRRQRLEFHKARPKLK